MFKQLGINHYLGLRLISEATLLAWVMRVHESLTEWEHVAIEQLLNMPVIYADETSIRINQKKHWIHSYSCAHLVMKICHPKRGKEAFDAINILPRYGAGRTKDDEDDQDCDVQQQESDPKDADPKDDPRPVVVHDRWATYFMYDNFADALCGAHLLRDLQFLIDAHDHSWPKQMMKLLLKANREVSKSEDKVLTDARFNEPASAARLHKLMNKICTMLLTSTNTKSCALLATLTFHSLTISRSARFE